MTTDNALTRNEQQSRGGGLANLSDHLRVERMLADIGDIMWSPVLQNAYSVSDYRRHQSYVEAVRTELASFPDDDTLRKLGNSITAALEAKPSRKVTATAVGLLFDSRVRQPDNPAIYLSALCADLWEMGYQPAVVAAACQRLRRDSKFVPEISEVIEKCRRVQENYGATGRLCFVAIERRREIEARMAEAASVQT